MFIGNIASAAQVFTFSCSFFDLTAKKEQRAILIICEISTLGHRLPSGLGGDGFAAQSLGQIGQGTVAIGAIALALVANPAGQLG